MSKRVIITMDWPDSVEDTHPMLMAQEIAGSFVMPFDPRNKNVQVAVYSDRYEVVRKTEAGA